MISGSHTTVSTRIRSRYRRYSHRFALVGTVVLFLISSSAAIAGPKQFFEGVGADFAAFYCGGAAVARHRNPYLVEPLRSCETRVQPSPGRSQDVVDSSPLPGYDLAFFALLSRLPYGIAKGLWFLTLFAALFVATFAIARLTRLPTAAVLVFLATVDGVLNFTYGQLPPIIVAALAASAYLLEQKRYVFAAAACSLTMLEPNLGLPACLALLIWVPRSRVPLTVAGLFFAGAALTTGGLAQHFRYLRTYLPAQARAELVATDQFSLSALLHLMGLSDRLALAGGTLSYAVMLGIGIYLAQRAAATLKSDAFIVLLPPAAVLLGGSYVHDIQFAAALPAALLLFAKTKPTRFAPWVVASLLTFPWFSYSSGGHSIGTATRLLGMLAIAWLAAIALSTRTVAVRLGGVCAAMFLFVALLFVLAHVAKPGPPGQLPLPASVEAGSVIASANWGAYLRATPALSARSIGRELGKVPFWFGIVLMLVVIARLPKEEVLSKAMLDRLLRRSGASEPALSSA